MRQLSCLLHISSTDWISPCHKASHSSVHSCQRTCLQQCWHMWICLRKFLGFPYVCVHCAAPVKGQHSQKADMSDVCPLGVWPLAAWVPAGPQIAWPHWSNYQLLQYVMQAKFIPLKSCFSFIFLWLFPSVQLWPHWFTHILYEHSRRIVFIRWPYAFSYFCVLVRA